MSNAFDIAVIGAGPGGYVAALKAAQLGAKVAIVEKQYLGGTCLNWGCVPSKALLASAELVHHIRHAKTLGIEVPGEPIIHWSVIQERKDKVVLTLRNGIKGLLAARKVTLFNGTAVLDGPGKVVVTDAKGQVQRLSAKTTILAPGSTPARIPGWPTDPTKVCTSDEALHWKTLPKQLLIVGGGVIGCEFACLMQALGVEVTIVEMLPQILPNMDAAVAQALTKSLQKRGIAIHTGVKIEAMELEGDGVVARLGDGKTIHADRVLVATGRRPATADLGLDTVGLKADRGFVRVNARMQTPVKGYYCIGDANGQCLLAHAASAHGVAAVEDALGHGRDFTAPIPGCVYTFPEAGSVGLTEAEAKQKSIPVSIGMFPLAALGKAMAANDTEGFVKVIRHRESDLVLGVHMVGHNATECIAAAGIAIHQGLKAHQLVDAVFAHPTMSEAIKESVEDSLAMGLHLPPRPVKRLVAAVK